MKYGITKDNINTFCCNNADLITTEVKGIVSNFHGLGFGDTFPLMDFAKEYAKQGILWYFPYYSPWAWMNPRERYFCDEVLNVLCQKLGIDGHKLPFVITGGSMGGHAALIYSILSDYKAVACAIDSPVCDLVSEFFEQENATKSIYLAYRPEQPGSPDILELLKENCPINRIAELPNIPYYVVQGTNDTLVDKTLHADVFAKKMKELGNNITYRQVEGMEHCNMPPEEQKLFNDFVMSFFK